MKALKALLEHGQSYWLDNLTRGMIRSGELESRLVEEGLRGMTSNPAIFHKAITGGSDYDEQIDSLLRDGYGVEETYEELVVSDIRDACDVLRPVWEESGGSDGFVSLEVSPYLARDTEGTIEEACRLNEAVSRPNLMVKIPGTAEGLPAIEECLFRGVNINITLLFAVERYREVLDAYMTALERRVEAGEPIEGIASVASFFLSRIDVLVDGLLAHRLPDPRAGALLGRVAVANAKVAYGHLDEVLASERWKSLEEAGAGVQRLLWASTSTKNPLYRDVRYVEPLIGPHTVNTMPDETVRAVADHGSVATTVLDDLEGARRILASLEEVGISLERVTWQLENEGVEKFVQPYDKLMTALAGRLGELTGDRVGRVTYALGDAAAVVEEALSAVGEARLGRRIHDHDPTPWTGGDIGAEGAAVAEDPIEGEAARVVRNRLGWIDAPAEFRELVDDLDPLLEEARSGRWDDVVLLGMGGSSLSSVVATGVFRDREGWPSLRVLDSTSPEAVRSLREGLDPARTLFVVASKSGTTDETLGFYRHFRAWVEDAVGAEEAGGHFVAVTDPGTPLAGTAKDTGFRALFQNPEDIGGRYSVLSWFGLVPMALCGIDVRELLDRALEMSRLTGPEIPASLDPGIRLGVALAVLARDGRDKVTFVTGPALRPFGLWAEQLLAESTGKDGTGLIPVAEEDVGEPADYGSDRVFVGLTIEGEGDREGSGAAEALEALEEAGHPVIRIALPDRSALGAEYLRWEMAVAAAAAVLGVNAFDEPNVAESKGNTRELLDAHDAGDALPDDEADLVAGSILVHAGQGGGRSAVEVADDLPGLFEVLGGELREGEYVALLPYLHETPERREALDRLRSTLRGRWRAATTLGFGPRYLHSTGQLHKGGPRSGLFLLFTAEGDGDEEIPGEEHGFRTLIRAQALGDFRSLAERGRRVLRLHLTGDVTEALERVAEAAASRTGEPVAAD